jgi:adenylate cyclase
MAWAPGVKNIAQLIRAFRVRLSDELPADESAPSRKAAAAPEPDRIAAAAPPPAPTAEDSAEFELAFWESMKDSQDAAEFAAYLEKYPDGIFACIVVRLPAPYGQAMPATGRAPRRTGSG